MPVFTILFDALVRGFLVVAAATLFAWIVAAVIMPGKEEDEEE